MNELVILFTYMKVSHKMSTKQIHVYTSTCVYVPIQKYHLSQAKTHDEILLDNYLQGKFHIAQVGRSRENTACSAHLSGLVITFACIIILRV